LFRRKETFHDEYPGNSRRLAARRQPFAGPTAPDAARAGAAAVAGRGGPGRFTASATDPDLPANALTFGLRNAPPGASIDPVTGAFSFTPPHEGTFSFDVVVTDRGAPPLSASQTVTITALNTDILAVGADAGGVPEVRVFDAATGTLKFDLLAYDAGFTGGVRVAVGDVTGDGIPDVITRAGPGAGSHVKVFDGQSGALLRSFLADPGFTGGVFVAAGDVDGDGRDEIFTGALRSGHVKVFGADQSELCSFLAYAGYAGAVYVASGDCNGDGHDDVLVGAAVAPHVKAFTLTLAEMVSFYVFDPNFTGGIFVG
jgi:hypothetical protein